MLRLPCHGVNNFQFMMHWNLNIQRILIFYTFCVSLLLLDYAFQFSTGTLRVPSYHRLLAHTRTFHLRQHNANFCQAQVLARSVLYGDASCHGKVISRNHLVPSVHLVQQKCLLSLSAAVSATSAADLVC